MATVHLVADSTCDLSSDEAAQRGLALVPLKVIIGEEVFADGVDISPAELYARMRAGAVTRTSQPTPGEFEAVFRSVGSDGEPIVCTTISAEMSGTYQSAVAARQALPDLDIRVIDTRTAAIGHRLVVDAVAAAAASGAGPDELESIVAGIRSTQRLVFTVESLEYLRRGGRIGGARALLGSVLSIKPVLEVRDGTVEPLDRVRTFARAVDRVLDELQTSVSSWGGQATAMVAHADNLEAGTAVARRASEAVGHEVGLMDVGPVIGCHGGPGAIGLAFRQLTA